MGLFRNLINKWTGKEKLPEAVPGEEEQWDELVYKRDLLDVQDPKQRLHFVQSCIDQMAEASRELDTLTLEYSQVTSYLTDMEEVENLPREMRRELDETASHILELDGQKEQYEKKSPHLSDQDYQTMEQLEEEVEQGIKSLLEAQEYQKKVRTDLKRLDNEKHAFYYRIKELNNDLYNYRGMSLIVFVTLVMCLILLLVLQVFLRLDTKIGYVIVVLAAALAMTFFYVKHNEAGLELDKAHRDMNKLILLQNTVKIRYVNNKNLLDYLRLKYHVDSGEKLQKLWQDYQVEREAREKLEKASQDFTFYQKDLLRILRMSRVKDPSVWLHQTAALVDPKEMVEIRHRLISRRQNLRSQMEYNKNLAQRAQQELKDLCRDYPEYAQEILQRVKLLES